MILTFAAGIVTLLKSRDPLSERVHLSPIELFAHGIGGIAAEIARRVTVQHTFQTGGRRMTLEAAAANASYGAAASGSSFYAAMRILPREQREAMFQIYSFCRQVDDIADSDGPRPERMAALQQWRDDINALYDGYPPARLLDYAPSVRNFDLRREDFLAIVDGMEMDVRQDIRAPDLATLDLYCDRVASAVGRLSVRVFGIPETTATCLPIISAARCN